MQPRGAALGFAHELGREARSAGVLAQGGRNLSGKKAVLVTVTPEDLAKVRKALKAPGAKAQMKAAVGRARGAPVAKAPSSRAVESFVKGLASVERATRVHGNDVFHSPRSANGSLVQASLESAAAKGVVKTEAVSPDAERVKFSTEDVAALVGWGTTWIAGHLQGPRPKFPKPEPDPVDLPFSRVALFSDWGTGMYGAAAVRDAILADLPNLQLIVHLGDTYYAGLPDEMSERAIAMWPAPGFPPPAGCLHRALNGNHEMYGNGVAYFRDLLPKLAQKESAFCFSNGEWLIVGLDTAYKDHNLHADQVAWFDRLLALAKTRKQKVVALSHHQLFDFGRGAGKKLRQRARELENLDQLLAWYWGHEHHAAIFERDDEFGVLGRCLGHGGMPEGRKKLAGYPVATDLGSGYAWKRFPAGEAEACPAGVVLDGPNLAPDMPPARRQDFAPHGYVILDFQGSRLFEEFWVVNWDGTQKRLVHRGSVDSNT